MATRVSVSLMLLLLLFPGLPALAGKYHELVPGVSTKSDADRFFGEASREIVPGERYDYPPDNKDTRRISIRLDAAGGTIRFIDIYPVGSYGSDRYREWFGLGEPDRTEYDGDGNLVEHYDAKGVTLRFSGPDPGSSIVFFRHFAPAVTETPTPPPNDSPPIPEDARAYLGVSVRNHPKQGILVVQVLPGSAAQRGGFRKGDVVLEFEGATFYGSADYREFFNAINAAPVSRPVRTLVERGSERVELFTTLDLRTQESIDRQMGLASRESFDRAAALVEQKKYDRAIPYLERATVFNYRDTRARELLGYCCLREKDYECALTAYRVAAQIAPDSPGYQYWIAVCYDRLGNPEKAIEYYDRYVQSGDANRKMTRDARQRAEYLRTAPQREAENAEKFINMIEAILDEIQD